MIKNVYTVLTKELFLY